MQLRRLTTRLLVPCILVLVIITGACTAPATESGPEPSGASQSLQTARSDPGGPLADGQAGTMKSETGGDEASPSDSSSGSDALSGSATSLNGEGQPDQAQDDPESASDEEAAQPGTAEPEPEPEKTYAKTVVSDTPIILKGDDILEITGTNFIHNESIYLEDNAQLIIRDSRLELRQDYAGQHGLFASGNSRVIFVNSELHTSCTGTLNWTFFDSSAIEGSDIVMPGCNIWVGFFGDSTGTISNWDYFGATTCDNAVVDIEDSAKMELELCYGPGVVVDETLPRDITEFTFPNENDSGVTSRLTVRNSSTDGWGIGITPQSSITIRDTPAVTISVIIGLPWKNETVVLDGIDSKLYEGETWQMVDSTLRLVNTTTYGWETGVFASRNTLIVRNSNFTGPTMNSEYSKVVVENSFVDSVRSYEHVEITVSDTVINGNVLAHEDSRITLIRCTVVNSAGPDEDGKPRFGNVRATGNSVITMIDTVVEGDIVTEDAGEVIVVD